MHRAESRIGASHIERKPMYARHDSHDMLFRFTFFLNFAQLFYLMGVLGRESLLGSLLVIRVWSSGWLGFKVMFAAHDTRCLAV